MSSYKRTGEFLLAKGLIDQGQLDRALEARSRTKLRLGEVLVVLGFVEEAEITRCLAEQFNLPIAHLSQVKPTVEALGLVTSFFALSHLFLPIEVRDDTVYAIIADPIDLEVTDKVIRQTGRRLSLALASPRALSEAVSKFYDLPELKPLEERMNRAPVKAKRRSKFDDQCDRQMLLEALGQQSSSAA